MNVVYYKLICLIRLHTKIETSIEHSHVGRDESNSSQEQNHSYEIYFLFQ